MDSLAFISFFLSTGQLPKGDESQEAGLEGKKMLLRFISKKHLLCNFSERSRVSEQPTHERVFVSFSWIGPDVEPGLATKEGGALTHFRCLQEGIFVEAARHDAPSFVALINCDSCSARGKKGSSATPRSPLTKVLLAFLSKTPFSWTTLRFLAFSFLFFSKAEKVAKPTLNTVTEG